MRLKKKHIIITSILIIIVCLFGFWRIETYRIGKRPFKDLDRSQVDHVIVWYGIRKPYYLSESETESFLNALREIVIYQKDNSYKEYAGVQWTMFRIDKTNGETIYVSAANPFFIINEVGYRTEYRACDNVGFLYSEYVEKILERDGYLYPTH